MRTWFSIAAFVSALFVPAATAQIAVVNGATFQASFPVAPGSLATAFGEFTGVTQAVAEAVPLPSTLAGVQVLVNNVASPLVFVSTSQINFQVPAGALPTGQAVAQVPIRVTLNGANVRQGNVTVSAASPGIFVLDFASPALPGAALNQNFSVNSAQNPVARGQILQLFATGAGTNLSAAIPDGAAPASLVTTVQVPDVFVSVSKAEVIFSGMSPQFPGVWQINIRIPDGAHIAGQVPVTLFYPWNLQSNTVSVWVAQ